MVDNQHKKQERKFLLEFKKIYPEFPQGDIIDCESPDFLIKLESRVIGIELERYVRDQKLGRGSGGSKIRLHEQNYAEFLKKLQFFSTAKSFEPLIVQFSWYGNKLVARKDMKMLAKCTVDFIESVLPVTLSSFVCIGREQLEDTPLEDYLSSIILSKPDGLKSSKWMNMGPAFRGLGVEELEHLISNKEQKINSYLRKCDEIWLLIVADGEYTSSMVDFPDRQFTKSFLSNFSKAFLYDRLRQKVTQLSE